MGYDPLIDSLRISDLTARHLGYHNDLDMFKVVLPASGDIAINGQVQINTENWPSGVPVDIGAYIHKDGLTTVDLDRHLTEKGEMYSVSKVWHDIADAEAVSLLICPKRDNITTQLSFTGGGEWWVELWENPTVSASGVAISSHNMDRTTTHSMTAEFLNNPTVTASGSYKIWDSVIGDLTLGINAPTTTWKLKNNTDYYVWLQNNSGGAASAAMNLTANYTGV